MRSSKFRAVGLAAALVGWSFAAPRVRWHPIPNASLGTGLVAITRSPLGLRPPALWSGMRYGLAAGAAAALGVAALTALPPVRRAMAQRDLPEHPGRWLLVSIPIGTVWPEEAAYRATLGTVAEAAFGPTRGRLLQAAAFGLWHVVDARITAQPVDRHRAGHRRRGLVLRLASRAVGQPRRADAGAPGGQRGRRAGSARRATAH